jgi:hypothetical protein
VPQTPRPRALLAALLLGLFALPALAAAPLPEQVQAALDGGDCAELMRLNSEYWRALEQEEAGAEVRAAAEALEHAILAQPLCGRADGELVQVRRQRGVNFFDHRNPAGLPGGGQIR